MILGACFFGGKSFAFIGSHALFSPKTAFKIISIALILKIKI
jgi:hypothetical protein